MKKFHPILLFGSILIFGTPEYLSKHSALIRNLMKLKGTAKLTVQGEWVSLKVSKYILFEILKNRTWRGCARSRTAPVWTHKL